MNIGWYYLNAGNSPIIGLPPEPAFKNIAQSFTSSEVPMCPAVGGYFKNTWIIKCPIDLEFEYDLKSQKLVTPYAQSIAERNFINHRKGDIDSDILSMPLRYVFVCDESVMIESIPAFMHRGEAQTKMRFVPGTFNINKWIRPVDFTAQLLESGTVKLKKGDPLFYVRFVTEEPVILEEINKDQQKKIWEIILKCTNYKFNNPKKSLKTLYDIAHEWLSNKKWLS